MADTGATSPGTLADDAAVGAVAWSNPGNAASSNDVYAVFSTSGVQQSHYLKATNFGFSVPAGATIDGVAVSIERKAGHDSTLRNVVDSVVKLVVGGTVSGNNKAATSTKWPTSDGSVSYGGAADLWGLTPSAADVNGSDFGVVLSATSAGSNGKTSGSVDHITITVTYTASSGETVSVTLGRSLGASAGGLAGGLGAAALGRSGGLTGSGLGGAGGAGSLGRTLAATAAGQGAGYSSLGLVRWLLSGAAGQGTGQASVGLGRRVLLVSGSGAQAATSLALDRLLAWVADATVGSSATAYDVALTLAGFLGLTSSGLAATVGPLGLARTAAVAGRGQGAGYASNSLGRGLVLLPTGQAGGQGALALVRLTELAGAGLGSSGAVVALNEQQQVALAPELLLLAALELGRDLGLAGVLAQVMAGGFQAAWARNANSVLQVGRQ